MVYIARGILELFLSQSACLELGLISPDFPTVREDQSIRAGDDGEVLPHGHGVEPPLAKGSRKVRFSSPPPLTHSHVGNHEEPSSRSGESEDNVLSISDVSLPSCTPTLGAGWGS